MNLIPLLGFIAIAVVTVAVGIYSTRLVRTTADVYVASRSVGPFLNASAIAGEYLSAASFLGVAGMVMAFGYDVLWYPAGYAAGYLFLLLFVAAPLRRFGAYTIADFAEGRFGSPALRLLAVGLVLVIGLFYLLPQMKGAGLTLQTLTGLPYWVGVVTVGGAMTLNVALGGMKGITFVQAFQFWVKAFAISVPTFVLLALFGSYGENWLGATVDPAPALRAAIDAGRAPGAEWGAPFGPFSAQQGAPLLFTYSLMAATVFGTAGLPHILVRFYTNRDGHAARRTTLVVLALIGSFYLFPSLIGLLGRVHATDLYFAGRTDAVVLELPGHIPDRTIGLVLQAVTAAGAFAAFMSTTSGLLVAVAGGLAHDLYARTLAPKAPQRARLRAFRVASLVAGAVAIVLGLQVERFAINMLVGWAFAIAASAFFPLMVLGIWWRGVTARAAAAGTLVGGGCATIAILYTMVAPALPSDAVVATLLAQPAIWTMPAAFITMIALSLRSPRQVPPDVGRKRVRLHVPESIGLRADYLTE